MRTAPLAAIAAVALVAALPASAAKDKGKSLTQPGTLAIEGARGNITVSGTGTLVGHVERGALVIVDLSSGDQWSPRVNGIPYGKTMTTRGRDLNFWIPGGRYRVVVKGEGISISARGVGTLHVRITKAETGEPVGIVRVGDEDAQPLSGNGEKMFEFGGLAEDEQPDEPDAE